MISCWSSLKTAIAAATLFCAVGATSEAQPARRDLSASSLPMDKVYQGPVRLPDFRERDRRYANFRTRISEGMNTGPDFAGHYAVVQIGCGTGCSLVYIGDVATGEVFGFPYGGEEYNGMQLRYAVKSNGISIYWTMNGRCFCDNMRWNGVAVEQALGRMELGAEDVCYRM